MRLDLISGLSAASQAVGLVKQLRDLDRALDEAAFKSKLIELQETVLDARTSLLEAREAILDRDARILDLQKALEEMKSGEKCPLCGQGSLKTISIKPHSRFAFAGVGVKTLKCDNPDCGHQETRLHDPDGRTKT